MRKLLSMLMVVTAMLSMLTVSASAADYSFLTTTRSDYYGSTSYEEVYGSQYNYGGPNVVDYQETPILYGNPSTTQIGVMEKGLLPGLWQNVISSTGEYGIGGEVNLPTATATSQTASVQIPAVTLPSVTAFTALTEDFKLSNGAIGRISIPAIGIKDYYLWEGETTASMKKGVAHFSSTSVWDGNVGICGHNRGSTYVIGAIKDLNVGDTITYTTVNGTRTYKVETVTKIQNDDWSYLGATSDNRITLITCVAGDSSRRWCVQAVEEG